MAVGIQKKRKKLTKKFMMIQIGKKSFDLQGLYKNISAL